MTKDELEKLKELLRVPNKYSGPLTIKWVLNQGGTRSLVVCYEERIA